MDRTVDPVLSLATSTKCDFEEGALILSPENSFLPVVALEIMSTGAMLTVAPVKASTALTEPMDPVAASTVFAAAFPNPVVSTVPFMVTMFCELPSEHPVMAIMKTNRVVARNFVYNFLFILILILLLSFDISLLTGIADRLKLVLIETFAAM
jgi:hypothetical protein